MPGWNVGMTNACGVLESDTTSVKTAALWRMLFRPYFPCCNSERLSICLSWPEVDLNRIYTEGWGPWGLPVIVKVFQHAPASTSVQILKTLGPSRINFYPDELPSLLHYAILFRCTEIVELLLELGAKVDVTTRYDSILYFARKIYFDELIAPKLKWRDLEITPLELGLHEDRSEAVSLILNHYSQKNRTPRALSQSIFAATRRSYSELVSLFGPHKDMLRDLLEDVATVESSDVPNDSDAALQAPGARK